MIIQAYHRRLRIMNLNSARGRPGQGPGRLGSLGVQARESLRLRLARTGSDLPGRGRINSSSSRPSLSPSLSRPGHPCRASDSGLGTRSHVGGLIPPRAGRVRVPGEMTEARLPPPVFLLIYPCAAGCDRFHCDRFHCTKEKIPKFHTHTRFQKYF